MSEIYHTGCVPFNSRFMGERGEATKAHPIGADHRLASKLLNCMEVSKNVVQFVSLFSISPVRIKSSDKRQEKRGQGIVLGPQPSAVDDAFFLSSPVLQSD